jgi:glycosyltransferase involved in cell wall biosynthesis
VELRAITKLMRQQQRALEKFKQTPRETREASLRTFAILQRIYDEEPANRRRLAELRGSPEYEASFDDPDPLVTVIIPTHSNADGLVTRAVPSVLAQTHENFELIVVGDGALPEIAEALRQFDDPRIVYVPKEHRGPYPMDADAFQRVKAVPPFNVGVRMARGGWIAPFADDDAFRPTHLEVLLRAARKGRYEFCYGRVQKISADGETVLAGEWPPELGRVSLQASLYHSGLTFIEHELADWLFGATADKSVLRRMLHAGVRFGFVDEVVVDYAWKRPAPKGEPS